MLRLPRLWSRPWVGTFAVVRHHLSLFSKGLPAKAIPTKMMPTSASVRIVLRAMPRPKCATTTNQWGSASKCQQKRPDRPPDQHEPCWYAVRTKGHWTGDRKQTTLWNIASGGQDSKTRSEERRVGNHPGSGQPP